jgi:hypothetical protein
MKNTIRPSASSNMVDSVFAGFDRARAVAAGEDTELDLETESEDDEESEDDSEDNEEETEEDSEDESDEDGDSDEDSEDDEESEEDESEDDESDEDEDTEDEDSEDEDSEDDEESEEDGDSDDSEDDEEDDSEASDDEADADEDEDESDASDEDGDSEEDEETDEADASDEASVIAGLVVAGHAIPVMISPEQIAESSLAEAIASLEDEEFSEEEDADDEDEEAESEDSDYEDDTLDDVLDDEDEDSEDDSEDDEDGDSDDNEEDEESSCDDEEDTEDDESESSDEDDSEDEEEDASDASDEDGDSEEEDSEDDEANSEEDDTMNFAPVASMDMLSSASASDVEMHLHEDKKNPHWNILVAGVPAARISLSSFGEAAGEVAAFFVTPKYAAGIRQNMAHAGVLKLLQQCGAEFYATAYTQSDLFSEARASASESVEQKLTLALANLREEFVDRLRIVAAGMDKNLWPMRNPLKQKMYLALSSAGVQNPTSIIDSVFAEAGVQHFEVMSNKALELMDTEPAALEQVRAMVENAGVSAPAAVASAQPAAVATASGADLIRSMMKSNPDSGVQAVAGSVAERKDAIRSYMH